MPLKVAASQGIPGFDYAEEQLSTTEESQLIERLAALPLAAFEFHGYQALRRVCAFGWRYDYGSRSIQSSTPLPPFLVPLRERAAQFAGLPADELRQTLVTEYGSGAGIGWHRDKAQFGQVVAISLASACTLRFRRRQAERWQRFNLEVSPRSVYRLSDAARDQWEHSIPAVQALRYSVTFRTLRSEWQAGPA